MKSHYEIVREYSQKDKSHDSGTKKVDYAFKVNGRLKFFVEAKEASVDLEKDKSAIYQAKRYAYSSNGKAPIVILTDFEEFRVFNVLKAPKFDNPDRELLKKYSMQYTDYLDKWDLLWDAFSKKAVENGSLDKLRGKIDKNTKIMDADFLEQITGWRETLAKNIALRNKGLSVDEINEAVQRILDRLLFIRNLEDREIEPENTLLNKTKISENIYKAIILIFNNLDKTYNGLLFKKHFSENLEVDDKTIHNIIKNMCYPVSPFQFDIIEPEILGRIYEKFLGSRIRLTPNHHAKIEEKIEVRKAGGVYYTPEYIVDYIVKNTVGIKIEGLTPEDIKKIKIVDPACGSGSFLIGAYSYILDYHQKWYTNNQKDKIYKGDWYKNKDGEIKARLDKRGDILKNNIFGVDIDKEATEVAIMSLYLKMLDDGFDKGERDLFFLKGHVLPDMVDNIKCGNSLIDDGYFEQLKFSIDEEIIEQNKVKPFNWKKEFMQIFNNGGFDIVISNPPYGAFLLEEHKKYYENNYVTYEYQLNSFTFFIEKGTHLLNGNGLISYIVPAVLHNQHYFSKIRKLLIQKTKIGILHIIKYRVFEQAETGDTLIFVLKNNNIIDSNETKFRISDTLDSFDSYNEIIINQKHFSENPRHEFVYGSGNKIIKKMYSISKPLSEIAYCVMGIKPYQTGKGKPKQTKEIVKNRPFDSDKIVNSSFKPYLVGKDINRYYIHPIKSKYIKYGVWLAEPRPGAPFEREKIVCRQTADHIIASLDINNNYNLNNVYNIESITKECSNYFLLGLLNSKLFIYLYYEIVGEKGRTFAEVKKVNLNKLPISIDNIEIKIKIEKNVKRILKANNKYLEAKSDTDKELLGNLINRIDKENDDLVYRLYNLTNEDILLIEKSIKN